MTQGNAGVYISRWELDQDISRWEDGTTNQFLFAEKHIPSWALRGFGDRANSWHGGYQMAYSNESANNIARIIAQYTPASSSTVNYRMFARGPDDPNSADPSRQPNNGAGWEALGSSHPGIVNFLLGDGAVRPVSISTQSAIVYSLTRVDDGASVALP